MPRKIFACPEADFGALRSPEGPDPTDQPFHNATRPDSTTPPHGQGRPLPLAKSSLNGLSAQTPLRRVEGVLP